MGSFRLTSTEQLEKKQEEKAHKRLVEIERARKVREAYEIREISLWMYWGPFLGLLVAAIAGLMIWLSGDSDPTWLWWIMGISIAPLIFFGIASDVDTHWKASVKAKEELHPADPTEDEDGISRDFTSYDRLLNGYRYKHDYVYTDSAIKYRLYQFSKVISGLSTIVFAVLAAILLFIWLGSISIAPTTIIIILLVMILMKK